MKNLIVATFLIYLSVISIFSYGQSETARAVYTEKIEVYTNSNFLVTGETLYYAVHCLNEKNKVSELSKLAYVELINENEKALLQSKILLVEGIGSGDFFLPSTLASGNYTLIGYTKWMRNFPTKKFFQKQITIVNPYLTSFNPGTSGKDDKVITFIRSASNENGDHSRQIQLTADRKIYSPRQKVIVVVKNNDTVHDVKVSLNVHSFNKAVATLSKFDSLNSASVDTAASSKHQEKDVQITFLPDLRGETMGGVVKNRTSNQPVVNTNIYLSASGTPYFFQVSKTDSIGRFYFSSKNIHTLNGIQFQIENESEPESEIILDDVFVNDYKEFRPSPFLIDTTLRREIEQRNVYSQIENAFYAKKRDSILKTSRQPFFGQPDKIYNLDDFTRFPTMEDIFREYMFEVVVSKHDKKFVIQLVSNRNSSRFLNTPLMLVDGIRVFDTEVLMKYNPLLIKKVSLVTRQYVYAGILYDGILSVDTYDGSAKELTVTAIRKDYIPWQYSKKYYSPMYDVNNDLKRIPDYRVQLFWNPIIHIEPGQQFEVEFYTSDIEGDFLMEANGYNSIGNRVSIKQHIEVRK